MSEELPVINWFEEPVKQSVKSVFDGLNDFVESLDLVSRYKTAHREIVRHQVSTFKVLGMQAPVDLTKVYHPTVVSTDIRRRLYRADWEQIDGASKRGRQKEARNTEFGDRYVEENLRVVVLGGPGAGKTTFLKFLALTYLDRSLFQKSNLKKTLLPIFLHLPAFARDKIHLLDALYAPLITKTDERARLFIRRLLETGNCVLLLDSLDELTAEQRQIVSDQIEEICKLFPRTKVIVSCRTADYHQVFHGFSEVEVSRLTKEGISAIVRAWFFDDADKAERLLLMLDMDESVSAMTETPLLLSLLCIQYRNDLALPKRRTELYRRCVDALLRDWDATRGFRRDSKYSELSDDRKESIFERVAAANCKDDISYEFHESSLLGNISDSIERFGLSGNDARGVLSEIESHHGVIEKCSAETYQFSHATMHEYFAARYFVATRQEMAVLKGHYGDDRWHTIITFMAAILHDPSALLEFLVQKSSTENFQNYPAFGKRLAHLLLLYRCMNIGPSMPVPLRSRVCDHLVQSQIHMMNQLNSDGVLPYAALRRHGVRQTLFSYSKPRTSIDKLLLPYRSLMNEAALSPMPEYVDSVYAAAHQLLGRLQSSYYGTVGLLTCLLAPTAKARPQRFLNWMSVLSADLGRRNAESVRKIVHESVAIHGEAHPELHPTVDVEQGFAALSA